MPRKTPMRDNVAAVRARLPHLSNLPREQIELALIHYESSVDQTVQAFEKDGAFEALQGWVDVTNHRENGFSKKNSTSNRKTERDSNAPLRPSQRVSNMFQMFSEGTQTNSLHNQENSTVCTPTSTTSSTIEQSLPSTLTTDQEEKSVLNDNDNIKPSSPKRRPSARDRKDSSSSQKHHHATVTSNKKLLTKSSKDLQRQTSTLTNVELVFNEEIKTSTKRIGELFKQMHDTLKDREVELYLELDQIKEQGLKIIEHRQKRSFELRQRMDRCDRMSLDEIEMLRNDIKQFVSERRYDLGEQLISTHRFEYDTHLVESLKSFGHVLGISRTNTLSTSSAVSAPQKETLINHQANDKENDIEIPQETSPLPPRNSIADDNSLNKASTFTKTISPSRNPRYTNKNDGQKRTNNHASYYDRQNMYNRNESRNVPRPPRQRPTTLTNRTTIPVQS